MLSLVISLIATIGIVSGFVVHHGGHLTTGRERAVIMGTFMTMSLIGVALSDAPPLVLLGFDGVIIFFWVILWHRSDDDDDDDGPKGKRRRVVERIKARLRQFAPPRLRSATGTSPGLGVHL